MDPDKIWYNGEHISLNSSRTEVLVSYAGIEFKDFILAFRQSTFLCTTLKCIESFHKIWASIHKIWDSIHKIWDSGFKPRIHGNIESP